MVVYCRQQPGTNFAVDACGPTRSDSGRDVCEQAFNVVGSDPHFVNPREEQTRAGHKGLVYCVSGRCSVPRAPWAFEPQHPLAAASVRAETSGGTFAMLRSTDTITERSCRCGHNGLSWSLCQRCSRIPASASTSRRCLAQSAEGSPEEHRPSSDLLTRPLSVQGHSRTGTRSGRNVARVSDRSQRGAGGEVASAGPRSTILSGLFSSIQDRWNVRTVGTTLRPLPPSETVSHARRVRQRATCSSNRLPKRRADEPHSSRDVLRRGSSRFAAEGVARHAEESSPAREIGSHAWVPPKQYGLSAEVPAEQLAPQPCRPPSASCTSARSSLRQTTGNSPSPTTRSLVGDPARSSMSRS